MKSISLGIKIISIFAIMIMVLPGYVSAENYSTISNEVTVNAPSIHAAQYDQLVNVADETSATNDQSWIPVTSGIYFGSSTPESSFQFNDVVTNNSKMMVSSIFKFSSAQIMSGVSEFRVRSPLIVSPDLVWASLDILRIPSANYSYNWHVSDWAISTANGPVWRVADNTVFTTMGYQSGASTYVEDDRLYYNMVAPIVPNVYYLFVINAVYSGGTFGLYLAPGDILGDGLFRTYINRYIAPTIDPAIFTISTNNYTIDAGWSFDMTTGYSAPITSRSDYYQTGDTISFNAWIRGFDNVSGYHIINIPFISDLGYLNATVSVYDAGYTLIWSQTETWYGYILASSPSSTHGNSIGSNIAQIVITINAPQHITWVLKEPERVDIDLSSPLDISYNVTSIIQLVHPTFSQFLYYSFFTSYIISSTNVSQVVPYYIQVIPQEHFSFQKAFQWAPLVLFVFFSGLALPIATSALAAQFLGISIVPNIGTQTPVQYGISMISWLNDKLPKIDGLDPFEAIGGFVSNLIDSVWNTLVGLGQWLWSVGEWLYNSLVWLANAIVEYGSILLGLLIVGVGLLLFFYPIYYQLKLWTAGLLLAQGKIGAASSKFSEVTDDIKDKTGRIRGLI